MKKRSDRPFANYEVEIIKKVWCMWGSYCNLWQVQKEVLSIEGNFKGGEKRNYQPHFCPQCQNEHKDRRLVEYGLLQNMERCD